MSDLRVGQRCVANDARGVIRYVGATQFASGSWVGVELDSDIGKNDGSVDGNRYFTCRPFYGVFVRASRVMLDREAIVTTRPSPRAAITSSRSTSAEFKTPTAVARPDLSRTPSKLSRPASRSSVALAGPMTKSTAPNLLQRRQSTIGTTFNTSAPSKRQSLVPSPRPSSSTNRGPKTPGSRVATPLSLTVDATPLQRLSQAGLSKSTSIGASGRELAAFDGHARDTTIATEPIKAQFESEKPNKDISIDGRSELAYPELSDQRDDEQRKSADEVAVDSAFSLSANQSLRKELDELKNKLKSLEIQRKDDQKRLSQLGALESEKEAWVTIRTKLREKLQSQQIEIRDLKDRAKHLETTLEEAKQSATNINEASADSNEILEMAMLDREMAEEERDQLKLQQEDLLSRVEELTLEVEIFREQQAGTIQTSSFSPVEIQALETQNDRLREALIRLKEITVEQDKTIAAANDEAEKSNADLEVARARLHESLAQVETMERLVDELKGQVDISIGAEEMLETLTDRNLSLGEQLEACKAEIADLEALRELNEELEDAHNQSQKDLLNELELRESIIIEQTTRIVSSEETLSEYAMTIRKFRDLVQNLEEEIEDMKLNGAITKAQTMEVSTQARELMAQNTLLRSSERQVSMRTLDVELKQLEATTAIEHLAILSQYLPATYELDKGSVETVLCATRLSSLCRMVYTNLMEQINTAGERDLELLPGICLGFAKLRVTFARLSRKLRSASPDQFLESKDMLDDLQPIVKFVSSVIASLQQNKFNDVEVSAGLSSVNAVVDHTISKYENLGGTQYPLAMELWQLNEMIILGARMLELGIYKVKSEAKNNTPIVSSDQLALWTDLSVCTNSTKVTIKRLRALTEDIEWLEIESPDPVNEHIASLCIEATSLVNFTCHFLVGAMTEFSDGDLTSCLSTAPLSALLASFNEALETLSKLLHGIEPRKTVQPETPWVVRGRALKESKDLDQNTTEKLDRVERDLRDLSMQLLLRDKLLEEEKVKSQLLTRRIEEQTTAIEEASSSHNNDQQLLFDKNAYEEAIEELTNEIDVLHEKLQEVQEASAQVALEKPPAQSDDPQAEITLLNDTISHLNARIAQMSTESDSESYSFLNKPLITKLDPPPKAGRELFKAIYSFYSDLKFVDFTETSPILTKWTPKCEQCGYVHFKQEEQYAALLGLKRQMFDQLPKV